MRFASVLAAGVAIWIASQAPVVFGDDCACGSRWSRMWRRDCSSNCCSCEECCCEKPRKKRCCLSPAEPPRGEVAFAIPAVVRRGQAVQISEAAMRRGIRSEAAKELAAETKLEGSVATKDTETLINNLERDVKDLTGIVQKLTESVDRLADRVP